MKRGKLIVIEGTDGSGKTTQAKLLVSYLKKQNCRVKFLDFPQYGKPSAAPVVEYLNGKYGSPKSVGPYRASILFALDRWDASFKLKQWLKEGYIVIANRYTASNMAHQGGKILSPRKRKNFFQWLEHLEYNIFQIPKPDINVILFVPAEISQKLVDKKRQRKYLLGKKRDVHEKDIRHLKEAQKVYLELAKLFPKKYTFIACVKHNSILSKIEIFSLVKKALQSHFFQ